MREGITLITVPAYFGICRDRQSVRWPYSRREGISVKAEKLEWNLDESSGVLSTGSRSSSDSEEVEMSAAEGSFAGQARGGWRAQRT